MRRFTSGHWLVLLLVAAFAMAANRPLLAQEPASARQDSLVRRLDRMQRQIDSLRRAAERATDRLIAIDERGTGSTVAARPAAANPTLRVLPSNLGINGKPFVRRFGSGTSVGGYVDLEFASNFTSGARGFSQRRLVPFIYSEITDRLHVGTEIEFENGPQLENSDGKANGSGEIKVEFATMDYRFTEALNLRAGVLLSPLGRFNLLHDSPINELTDRPLVALQVIPSTLSEAGAGLFGTLYPSSTSLVSYELYAVNGFSSALGSPESDGRLPIRDATGKRGDIDGRVPINLVGRLALSPVLGLELGASGHTGSYGNDLNAEPARRATIWALDATLNRGPVDLLGEYARLQVDVDPAVGSPAVGDGRTGFYLQGNYHFGQGWLTPRSTSSFTGVVRYDWVDYNRGVTGDEQRRTSVGLNWRPVPDAVFKSELQFGAAIPAGATSYGAASRRMVLSLATYF